jgi:predicted transposase/invertase (TIGR01784 family)
MDRIARNINPFTDFGFKKLFGEQVTKDLLLDFINAVLEGETDPVVDLEYSKNEHLGPLQLDRKVVFDIYCLTDRGERIIVEMQKAFQTNLKDRSLYYTTFPLQEQAKKGDWDFSLKAVYCISVLDFKLSNEQEGGSFLHRVGLVDRLTGELFSDKLHFVYLEVPRFDKKQEELETKFDKWMYVLKHLEYLERLPGSIQEKIFSKVMDIAELVNLEKKDRKAYEESLKNYRDLKNALDSSEVRGFEKGIEKGIEQGRQLGIEETQRQNIISFNKEGIPVEIIARALGMEIEAVRRILKEAGQFK